MHRRVKGTMTMEAAVIMPIFIIVIMSFTTVLHIIYVQMCVQSAIDYVGMSIQAKGIVYDYIYSTTDRVLDDTKHSITDMILNGTGLPDNELFGEALDWSFSQLRDAGVNKVFDVMVEEEVNRQLKTLDADYSCIVGGLSGIEYGDSSIVSNEGDFEIVAKYKVKIPIFFSRNIKFKISQGIRAKMFGGSITMPNIKNDEEIADADQTQITVYITEHGDVYHRSKDCVYLTNRMIKEKLSEMVDKRNNSGGKYYMCERCGSETPLMSDKYVYYSVEGERYHVSLKCPSISRNMKETNIEEIGGRKECAKCGTG